MTLSHSPDETIAMALPPVAEILAGETVVAQVGSHMSKDGDVTIESLEPIYDTDGRFCGFRAYLADGEVAEQHYSTQILPVATVVRRWPKE